MRSLPVLAVLALAGCGTAPAVNEAAPANEAAPVNAVAPAANEQAAATPAETGIPAAMHGRWGLVPNDCTSTLGDAHGLLTVTAERLEFYESRATVANAIERTPERLVADFAFTGEGQTWSERMTLALADGGATLVRTSQSPDAATEPLRYSRCPADSGAGRTE